MCSLLKFLNSNLFLAIITLLGIALPVWKTRRESKTDKKWAIAALYVESKYYLKLANNVYARLRYADFFNHEDIFVNKIKWQHVVEELLKECNDPIYSNEVRIQLDVAVKSKGITSDQAKHFAYLFEEIKQIESLFIDLSKYVKLDQIEAPKLDKGEASEKETLKARIEFKKQSYMSFMEHEKQDNIDGCINLLKNRVKCFEDIRLNRTNPEDFEYIKRYRASREKKQGLENWSRA